MPAIVFNGFVILVISGLVGCDAPDAPAAKGKSSTVRQWTRQREGALSEEENLYNTFEKYPDYGILTCGMSNDGDDAAFKKRIARAIDVCREDYAGVAPSQMKPSFRYVEIVVHLPGKNNSVGMIASLSDILSSERSARSIVESGKVSRNAQVQLTIPGKEPWVAEDNIVFPIIEAHMGKAPLPRR